MKLRRNLPLFFAIGAWIVFLWLHTVIYMVNYEGNAGIWGYLICALSMMIAAFLLAYCFLSFEELFPGGLFDDPDDEFFEDDSFFEEEDFTGCFLGKRAGKLFEVMSKGAEEEEFCLSMDTERPKSREEKTGTLQKSMTCVFVLAFVFFAALALERQTSFFDFYRDKTYIFAGFISINKEYLYDLILFLIFPFWVRIIFKGLEEEKFSCRSAALGGLQLAMLTIMQFLLFMEKSNVWMIELAAVDLLTVTAAVRSFVWKDTRRKGNAAAGVILYAGLWAGLLVLLHYPGQTLTQYTYAGNWAGYAKTVSRLLENAAAEPSFVLQTDQQIQELLFNHGNYLQSALYYWGWAAALAITVLLLVFLAAARKLLGKAKDSRNYLIYHAAWWSLAFRVLVGIPYSLGILPLPIGLPFAGETSLYMDTIAFALLIWCWRENKKAEAAHGGQAAGEKELEEETERPEKRGIRALPAVLAGVLVAAGLIGWNFTAKSAVRRIYPVNISINYTEGYSAMHALRGVKQLRCFTRYAENKSAGEMCCLCGADPGMADGKTIKETTSMKTVKKKTGKLVKAYCLGESSKVIDELTEKGLIKQTDESHWRIFSQEATDGEEAKTGDYIKTDSAGRPYPNSWEFFLKNHRPLGGDEYEQIPKPLKAWDIEEPPCQEVEFLISHKGLVIDESSETAYFSAPLWGDTLTAARDAVIVFYDIQYDDSRNVTDADFNFVSGSEFKKTYDVL